jgi:hypothetical protein
MMDIGKGRERGLLEPATMGGGATCCAEWGRTTSANLAEISRKFWPVSRFLPSHGSEAHNPCSGS